MNILPIQQISEHDQEYFGSVLYKLAQLKRSGLAVVDGLAVAPPDFLLQTVIKHFQDSKHEVFEQRLELVRSEISKTPAPKELTQNQWRELLDYWIDIIKRRIWTQGFTKGVTQNLPSRIVVSTKGDVAKAFYNPQLQKVVVQSEHKLSVAQVNEIEKLVTEVNKKLVIPQSCSFLVSSKTLLAGVSPYTEPVAVSSERVEKIPEKAQQKLIKSVVKVYGNLPVGWVELGNLDGVLVESGRFSDSEQLLFRVQETALRHPLTPLLIKLPNSPSELQRVTEAIKFLYQKKGHLQISIATPEVHSVNDFSTVKKQLPKINTWLTVSTPENLINSQQYLEVGIDGVLLDLDNLHSLLFGYHSEEGEFYKHEVKTLIEFLTTQLKIIHKAKVPIVAFGNQVFHPDVLHFLVEDGVYGVVANTILEAESLPETLSWVEKRVISKKVTL